MSWPHACEEEEFNAWIRTTVRPRYVPKGAVVFVGDRLLARRRRRAAGAGALRGGRHHDRRRHRQSYGGDAEGEAGRI